MIGHFIVWCARNVFMSFVDSMRSLAFIHRTIADGYVSTVQSFHRGFTMGLLGAIISIMMSMGISMAITAVAYWGELDTHRDSIITTIRYSMAITASFYVVCFIHALYEKFLCEYEATWNILKEEDDVSDLGR
jgi:uncharacterized BrkB/YihY/UPF0761 family membrane protein